MPPLFPHHAIGHLGILNHGAAPHRTMKLFFKEECQRRLRGEMGLELLVRVAGRSTWHHYSMCSLVLLSNPLLNLGITVATL